MKISGISFTMIWIWLFASNALPAGGKSDEISLKTYVLDAQQLRYIRQKVQASDPAYQDAVEKLIKNADQALNCGPFTVINKPFLPPSGDKHDYMSIGPYWWPDPDRANGLPYIRRDGEVNPERDLYDRIPLRRMDTCLTTLGLAYFYTGNENYARHAAELIKTWFLNDSTRMNPHLEYGQAIPGRTAGRGTGIIDTRAFFRIVDVIGLLKGSDSWSDKDTGKMINWFNQYLDWMIESKNGIDEKNSMNNHGTWYDVISASLSRFTGREDRARNILTAVPTTRIDKQIYPDGRQPLELERTRAFHYSAMNLQGLFHTALLAEKLNIDLWHYESEDGRSMKKALDFLLPFATGREEWPYEQLKGWEDDFEIMFFLCRLAAHRYNEPQYEEYARRFPNIDYNGSLINLLYGI